MQIPLSFKRMLLPPGKTFAVPTVAGARVRVVEGTVWATTSANPDDVWLHAGQEHTLSRPGLTVIESVGASTVDLIPPAANDCGRILNRFDIAVPKLASYAAAIVMAAITLVALVVLPATIGAESRLAPGSSVATASAGKVAIDTARNAGVLREQTLVQAHDDVLRPASVE